MNSVERPSGDDSEITLLTRLRESEKRSIATWVLIGAVVASTAALLLLLVEVWFFEGQEFLGTRCLASRAAMFDAGEGGWIKYVVAFFAFAAGVVSKDVHRVYSWRIIVGAALVGFAAALVFWLSISPMRAAEHTGHLADFFQYCAPASTEAGPWAGMYPSAENDDEAYTRYLAERLNALALALAAWYGWVVATQFGLNIDGVSQLASRGSGGAAPQASAPAPQAAPTKRKRRPPARGGPG
jgi:hypothetical protein